LFDERVVLGACTWRGPCSVDDRVPSFSHEMLVDLFRVCGELAPALLELCADLRFAHDRVEQGPADLSQVVSTEYRADRVVILHDGSDVPVAGVVVEVQLAIDRVKRRTWPVYVTALRAEYDCPVVLLVLAPDPGVARWARRPIALGHPGFCLEPLVIEFADMPRIVDAARARKLPELAVLSTLAHPELDVASAAITAISDLPEDRARLYLDVILAALSASVRKQLENRMRGYEYQSEFARKYYFQGHDEGREKGREEGREEGRESGLRTAVRELLQVKVGPVTAEDEAAIAALHDDHTLVELVGALGRSTNAAEARMALAACTRR
jgi:hypothetical protein